MPARTKTPPDPPDDENPDVTTDVVTDDTAPDDITSADEESADEAKYRARGWTRNENGDLVDSNGDLVPMIVHNERVVDAAGTVHTKPHGPMPAIDWPDYEKRHGL